MVQLAYHPGHKRLCSVKDCTEAAVNQGVCKKHHRRIRAAKAEKEKQRNKEW